MLSATLSRLSARSASAPSARAFSAAAAAASHSFALRSPLKVHLLDDPHVAAASSTRAELMGFHREMYTIRRMEIGCDTEYKARNIRGFCHLYDGQEAIAAGLQAGLTKEDNIITSYRCHGIQYIRGEPVKNIVAELFGFEQGCSKGKGGSMHLYSKKRKFWGGSGIVGAQVPVGVGVAFAEMYKNKGKWPANVAVAMYGDGAANQGQIWEVANMAKLWNIPAIFLCENNQYGMGTAVNRSSCNTEYYKAGGVVIPGVQADGMDALAVREAVALCKAHAGGGKGPIFLELKTYRYHGHSMSDPGVTYRDRDEVAGVRASKDCIEQVKARLLEAGFATEDELKAVEKEVRTSVSAAIEEARRGNLPPTDMLHKDIYFEGPPKYIQFSDRTKSLHFA